MKKFLPLLALLAFTAACSPAKTADPQDPYENINRGVFKFNEGFDRFVFKPVAQGYHYVTPDPIRERIGHFSDNLYEPLSFFNSMLQGQFTRGMQTFWRFVLNSTVGIGGLNDVATTAGIPEQREDFGQTLAVWGVGTGPYVVLPILGPSSVRDTAGTVTDWFANPVNWVIDNGWTEFGVAAGHAVVERERLIDPIQDIYDTSLDPYVSFRSIYFQRRAAEINNQGTDQPKIGTGSY